MLGTDYNLQLIGSFLRMNHKVRVALDQTAVAVDSNTLEMQFRPAGRKTRFETHRGQRCLRDSGAVILRAF